ncbi:MAG: alpha/beta hydrolase [Gemmatimonadales bacterium]
MSADNAIRSIPVTVPRTARVALLGPAGPGLRELWYVLHGYGQLAAPFLENFRALDDGTRLIVAPEALSRFYEGDAQARLHKDAAVGASWMTREDRESEIADYIAYLTIVHATIRDTLGAGTPPAITVLGFSQGGATAARWVARGYFRAARLIVWGSQFPPELDLADPAAAIRRAETTLVIGTKDIFATPKIVAKEIARLDGAGFPYRFVRFEGGHRLDDDTLRAL